MNSRISKFMVFASMVANVLLLFFLFSVLRNSKPSNPNTESLIQERIVYVDKCTNNNKESKPDNVLPSTLSSTQSKCPSTIPTISNNNNLIGDSSVPRIVTATSSGYFDRLENFVGSVHRLYERKAEILKIDGTVTKPPNIGNDPIIKEIASQLPSNMKSNYWLFWTSLLTPDRRPILVYDLGLTSEQRKEVLTWKYVELVAFPFENYPTHFKDLKNFAWKAAVMVLALEKYPSIIFLDSGVELWNRLDLIENILMMKNSFNVVQEGLTTAWKCCGTVGELTHEGTFNALGLKRAEYNNKVMCSGGIQGYIKDSYAYTNVLLPALECAKKEECIAPPGSDLSNHRQDQSVFSLLIHKAGLPCDKDVRLWGNPGNLQDVYPSDEEKKKNVVIYLRKGDKQKPYIPYLLKKKPNAVVVTFAEKQLQIVLDNIELWSTKTIYQPCLQPLSKEIDLIFYSNRKSNNHIISSITNAIYKHGKNKDTNPILKCFRNVHFRFADLSDERDKYPQGPNNQFYDLLLDPQFYNTYDYFFYMEPDCKAIRPNWVNGVNDLTEEYQKVNPNFWIIGSIYRGTLDLGQPLQFRFHTNGNAIYTTDISYRAFSQFIRSDYNFAYDTDPFVFLFEEKHHPFTRHIWNRIVFHDFVQNWWHDNYKESIIRNQFPRTFFIHGGRNEEKL
ncbi:hypothetical protein ABK040_002336 [Willaertia magna]